MSKSFLVLAAAALGAPFAAAQLFVTTLDATDVTADSAVLRMTVSGPADTLFIGQRFEFGTSAGALDTVHFGCDYKIAFGFDPESPTGRTLYEFHNVYDQNALFEITWSGELYDYQTMEYGPLDTAMTLTLPGLEPDTTYFFRATAIDAYTGAIYYGEELSFTTFVTTGAGLVTAVPELSDSALLMGLGVIGAALRRRRRA